MTTNTRALVHRPEDPELLDLDKKLYTWAMTLPWCPEFDLGSPIASQRFHVNIIQGEPANEETTTDESACDQPTIEEFARDELEINEPLGTPAASSLNHALGVRDFSSLRRDLRPAVDYANGIVVGRAWASSQAAATESVGWRSKEGLREYLRRVQRYPREAQMRNSE
jgi:hypothetical protein